MDEWRELVEEKLKSFDTPIDMADLCRLTGCPLEDMAKMMEEISRISKALNGTPYTLVVDEGKCIDCFKAVRFTGKMDFKCSSCGGFVMPPKVCINQR
jgi:predicted Zn-ribbon and HTH transcriptional regulator